MFCVYINDCHCNKTIIILKRSRPMLLMVSCIKTGSKPVVGVFGMITAPNLAENTTQQLEKICYCSEHCTIKGASFC
jgi:hypothetical protein